MGWPSGLRLAIEEVGGVHATRTDPTDDCQVTGQGYLRLPAALQLLDKLKIAVQLFTHPFPVQS